jgi:thiol-disulfide isomerase/thioredoxin
MAGPRRPSRNPYFILALLLVGAGLWQAYAPLLRDKDGVVALTRSTQEVTAADILNKSVSDNGKPTLVYFYASWCDTCRITTPLVASYVRNHRFDNVNLLFLAMEHDGYTLAAYLQKKDYGGLWKPYFMKGTPDPSLNALSPRVSEGIPLLLLLDEKGKLLTQARGALRTDDLDALLERIR